MGIGDASDGGEVLGRLTPIEHGVVPHDADMANAVRVREQYPLAALEIPDRAAILPDQHEAQIAWVEDGVVNVPADQCVPGIDVQTQELRTGALR